MPNKVYTAITPKRRDCVYTKTLASIKKEKIKRVAKSVENRKKIRRDNFNK